MGCAIGRGFFSMKAAEQCRDQLEASTRYTHRADLVPGSVRAGKAVYKVTRFEGCVSGTYFEGWGSQVDAQACALALARLTRQSHFPVRTITSILGDRYRVYPLSSLPAALKAFPWARNATATKAL